MLRLEGVTAAYGPIVALAIVFVYRSTDIIKEKAAVWPLHSPDEISPVLPVYDRWCRPRSHAHRHPVLNETS